MAKDNTQLTIKQYLASDTVQERVQDLLKGKAQQFMVTLTALTTADEKLATCEPKSLVGACLTATAMDLPVNPNLGFVYIIPYTDRKTGITSAQLQFGYKAFIQLAMRSGQFKTISATPVYEGQIVSENPLTGYEFDFTVKESDKVVGYAGYFKLTNGFEKVMYMTMQELKAHGLKYSQSFKRGYGLWEDNFDAMATKTVLKLLLSKYAPMSIEMEKAVITDQSKINDLEGNDFEYIDNKTPNLEEVQAEKEAERISTWIDNAKDLKALQEANDSVYATDNQELIQKYETKAKDFSGEVISA